MRLYRGASNSSTLTLVGLLLNMPLINIRSSFVLTGHLSKVLWSSFSEPSESSKLRERHRWYLNSHFYYFDSSRLTKIRMSAWIVIKLQISSWVSSCSEPFLSNSNLRRPFDWRHALLNKTLRQKKLRLLASITNEFIFINRYFPSCPISSTRSWSPSLRPS
jgi:hypothetical protein